MSNQYEGSNFEDFLESEGMLEDCQAVAIKFMIAEELKMAIKRNKWSKSWLARKLETSRSAIDRLLDPKNTSITLHTLSKVAAILGRRLDLKLS